MPWCTSTRQSRCISPAAIGHDRPPRYRRGVVGGRREAHIPAQLASPGQEARVPCPHEHPRRPCGAEEPAGQGPRPSVGLIHRVRGRTAFERLARDGRRVRRSALWCSWCPESPSTNTSPAPASSVTAVAFALGRALGPAVTRNRLRRQLRSLCRELDRRSELPPGLLLIGAKPAATELTFDQLEMELRSMVRQLTDGSRR